MTAPAMIRRPAGDREAWPAPTRVAARQEPALAAALRGAWRAGQAAVSPDRLLAAAATGDVDGLLQALAPARTAAAVVLATRPRLVSAVLSGARVAGEGLVALGVPVVRSALADVRKRQPLAVSLDGVNTEAVRWAEAHAAALVVADPEIQAAIRALVVASQGEKVTVRDLARQVRELVGLDGRRMAAVAAFETRLREAGITAEALARRVDRYAEAQRKARALLIARTETIAALAHGQQALWAQAVGKGLLNPRAIGKTWIVTDDEVLCPQCEQLGEDDPVGIGEPFRGGLDGPPAHPACRCATGLAPLAPKEAP